MQVLVEKIIGRELDRKLKENINPRSFFEEKSTLKECLDVAKSQHRDEMKDLVKSAVVTLQENGREYANPFVNPLTVASLFYLISPRVHHLQNFSFVVEDVEDFVERIQPLSFRFALKNEIAATLDKLEEIMLPELERYSVFSSLSQEKKKKVIFYLLIINLPQVAEEILRV